MDWRRLGKEIGIDEDASTPVPVHGSALAFSIETAGA
ncbi:hypothetical protein N789_05225 [Arenimonas oryziterrae DSM 21050 = YC6267]|uniref:Uncharacterized protein n=1 Tax=Arenimonas oryziterrae DSM 21050 = YC6267 TaxID=1121015 RepID=A0A091APH5_9GAMM|nr:hypothetical protein N789_05225 [Arenimonas oryziterrae DSM 21050 = YC6267]